MPRVWPKIAGLNEAALRVDAELYRGCGIFRRLEGDVDLTIGEHLESLASHPSWGLLHAIYKRASNQLTGCFVLLSHGHHACAEALCRTAVEASINLSYCSVGESERKVLAYFKDYILTEREQNKRWLRSVDGAAYPADAARFHGEKIAGKEAALRQYEDVLVEAFRQIGLDYNGVTEAWPSLFDRFKALGKEVQYRTVYASLCSQAHNDAEDLLNDFVLGVTQAHASEENLKKENVSFAVMMVLIALRILIESAGMYLGKYSLGVRSIILPLLSEIDSVTQRVTERRELGGTA